MSGGGLICEETLAESDAAEEAGIVTECRGNDEIIEVLEFGVGEVVLQ